MISIKNLESRIMHPSFGGKLLIPLFSILIVSFSASPVYADCVEPGGVKIKDCFGFGDIASFGKVTGDLTGPVFSVVTALVVIYFLWGAFKLLISGADKEQIAGAKQMITHSIIGFIILIFAFFILQFLLSSLFGIKDYQLIK